MDHIKAWKDPVYRASLSDEERAALPASPAGFIELSDTELDGADGGTWTWTIPATGWLTSEFGCFSWNGTVCNGTCAFNTTGCCGG
jgi:mersacidin/lichenicidin family type 2 lantibiotic